MKHIPSLSKGFLVTLLLSLAVGCGPEFQGTGYQASIREADAGAAGAEDEPQAGAPSAATGGSSGSGGSAGAGARGGATGKGGSGKGGSAGSEVHVGGAAGSDEPQAGVPGSSDGGTGSVEGEGGAGSGGSSSAGSAGEGAMGGEGGGAPTGPTCDPSDEWATIELNQATFTLGEYSWTDGENCVSCPEGGCGTCTVETAWLERLADPNDPNMNLRVTAHCDGGVLTGTCGQESYCDTQALYAEGSVAHFIARVALAPKGNGYELTINRNPDLNLGMTTHGVFSCATPSLASEFLTLFYDTMDHSILQCE